MFGLSSTVCWPLSWWVEGWVSVAGRGGRAPAAPHTSGPPAPGPPATGTSSFPPEHNKMFKWAGKKTTLRGEKTTLRGKSRSFGQKRRPWVATRQPLRGKKTTFFFGGGRKLQPSEAKSRPSRAKRRSWGAKRRFWKAKRRHWGANTLYRRGRRNRTLACSIEYRLPVQCTVQALVCLSQLYPPRKGLWIGPLNSVKHVDRIHTKGPMPFYCRLFWLYYLPQACTAGCTSTVKCPYSGHRP